MAKATEIKRGLVLKMDGDLWNVLESQHVTPGNWRGSSRACSRAGR